ncbi:EAL domain-containing protein [Priestia flexa]|uniref:EAL domain-containing protein n=1 Tax=Priestia flexa TaxID=86664 RepID=UPI002E23E2C1|nr:EAL domain-containing protein [Priestia flexa]
MHDSFFNHIASTTQDAMSVHTFNTALIEASSHAIFLLDEKGDLLFYNKQASAFVCTEVQDQFSFFQLVEYGLDHQKYFTEALKGEVVRFTTILKTKFGKSTRVMLSYVPILIEGQLQAVYAICKKKSEEQLNVMTLQTQLNMEQKLANIGSWYYDVLENESYWSRQMYVIFGMEETSDFIPSYDEVLTFVHPGDRQRVNQTIKRAIEKGDSYSIKYRLVQPSGHSRIVFEQADPVIDEKNQVVQLLGVVFDVTEIHQIKKQLKQVERQFSMVYNSLDVGIWSADVRTNKVTFCSDGVANIYEEAAMKFIQSRSLWKECVHPDDLEKVEAEQVKLMGGEPICHYYRIVTKKGITKWLKDQVIPVLDDSGKVIRLDGIVEDVTEQKRYTDEIEYLANYDYLTNLPNRRKFERDLTNAIARVKKNHSFIAVFYLGLDRFKYLNDTLGHDIGDLMLQKLAHRLEKTVQGKGSLSRVGGDEFAIFFESLDRLEECTQIAKSLFEQVEREVEIDEFHLHTTTSMGITIYPHDGKDAKTLLKNASLALYRAKELGKNDWQLYSPHMDSRTYKSFHLEKGLRNAIEQNEFFLHYQPKINTQTRELDSFEALIRWDHPEWGFVSPGEFIPLAEESNLIVKIGDWVLERVCQQLQEWKQLGLTVVPMSVNLSSKRLLKPNFVEFVMELLERYDIDSSLIELEITENSIIHHEEQVKKMMTVLKKQGVTFALDDFGTGFSSLSHLQKLDFDVLKIDKTFIQSVVENEKHQTITKSLLYLARGLNMKVIAEGVETRAQLSFLEENDCPFIQGYIFSKPVCIEQAIIYLKAKYLEPVV